MSYSYVFKPEYKIFQDNGKTYLRLNTHAKVRQDRESVMKNLDMVHSALITNQPYVWLSLHAAKYERTKKTLFTRAHLLAMEDCFTRWKNKRRW